MPINYRINFVCNIFCIKLLHKFLSDVLLIHAQASPYSSHPCMKKMPCSDIITTEHIQSYIHFLHPGILFLSIILRRLQTLGYILRLPIYTDIRIFSGKLQHICILVVYSSPITITITITRIFSFSLMQHYLFARSTAISSCFKS